MKVVVESSALSPPPPLSHFHSNLVSKYEDGFSVITSLPKKAESLEKLFLSKSRPLVGEFTTSNQLRVYDHRPLLVAYLDVNWKPGESKGEKEKPVTEAYAATPHTLRIKA